jgi:prepilin-type N-terminal cleavage/methylation domain-containing protein
MHHYKNNSHAFTLIELLVVISIIGLLSSFVLAALNGAKAKAVIAADQTFDSNNHAVFYGTCSTCTTADWDFDEGLVGGVVPDQSGNGNDLSLAGGASLSNTQNPFITGKVLLIDPATNDSVSVALNPNTVPSNQNGQSGDFSVSFWLYPTAYANGQYSFISNNKNIGSGSWKFGINNANNSVINFYMNGGTTFNSVPQLVSITAPMSNQWTQIVLVCNSSRIGVYINAKSVVSPSLAVNGCGFSNSSTIYIPGSISGDASPPQFYLDNLRIYKQALPISVIQSLYLAESKEPRHLAERIK